MKKLLLLGCLCVFTGAAAFAEGSSVTLSIASRLLPVVSVSITDLDFGVWDLDDTVKVASTTITVQATTGTEYVIALDEGQHANGEFWRYVQNGTSAVPYLIVDPTGSFFWGDRLHGDTYAIGNVVGGSGNGLPQSFTADGFLFAQFANPASLYGQYTDTVTVTVYY